MNDLADIFIVGGGINGAGIARDAAGRGLKVILAEKDDLASHTSSASSKLIHGGLRYLEHYEFRLVRESLMEREVLLQAAPHLIHPMRFILPHHKAMRPAFFLRLGLFLYDHIGGRKLLPATATRNLRKHQTGQPLKGHFKKGFEYSDCWVDDARLVMLAAKDAAEHGAKILTRTEMTRASRSNGIWTIETTAGPFQARALVNAAGPWVDHIEGVASPEPLSKKSIRMVKGSHIVVPKLYEGNQAYTFQNDDNRVIFAIPYQGKFTLIGTTDVPFSADANHVHIDGDETTYLCDVISRYFNKAITAADVLWSYSGVRPLVDDGAANASKATRDYVLELDTQEQAPMLSVYGGKITTFRCLAEDAMQRLRPHLEFTNDDWTANATLPGGDMSYQGLIAFRNHIANEFSWLDEAHIKRLMNAYGTRIKNLLAGVTSKKDLGQHFGADLYEAELKYMVQEEWATCADDALWRRSKLGLHLTEAEQQAVKDWFYRP
jgi:glycerol-3-phosphate dehydrogenase